jgi:hypothetical protein
MKDRPAAWPLWLAMSVATGIYLWLMSQVPLSALVDAAYDDVLFVKLAEYIRQGQWLGPYDQYTLIKGPLFPAWIAANSYLGLPLMLSQAALYALSGWLLVLLLRPHARPALLGGLFAAYLFNPQVYNLENLRVLRQGLDVPLAALCLALAAGWLAAAQGARRGLWLWALGLGPALAAYWLNREEGVWLLPALAVLLGAALVSAWRRGQGLLPAAGSAALVLATAAAGVGAVSWVDHKRYGVADIVEFKQREFVSAYGALSRIRHAAWRPYVPVPQEALAQAFAASPALAELRTRFNGAWIGFGCRSLRVVPCDGEYRGGWFMYALREAASRAGYHRTALAARDFYGRIARELDAACVDGRLSCLPPRATMLPPFRRGYATDTLRIFWRGARFMAGMDGLDIRMGSSRGLTQDFGLFQRMIKGPFFAFPERWTLRGEVIEDSPGFDRVEFSAAEGGHFSALQQGFSASGRGRFRIGFELRTDCLDSSCVLVVRGPAGIAGRVAVSDLLAGRPLRLGRLQVSAQVKGKEAVVTGCDARRSALALGLLRRVGWLYRVLTPIAFILALLAFAWSWARVFRERRWDYPLVLSASCLAAVCSRLLIFSYMEATFSPTVMSVAYFAPAYPLLILFIGLALAGAAAADRVSRGPAGRPPTGPRGLPAPRTGAPGCP